MKKNLFKKQPAGPSFDVILKLLELAHEKKPDAVFISSLLGQYRERGGLSKKQLEGLHSKAGKIEGIPPQYLATLEAIILKKHSNQRSVASSVVETKEEEDQPLVDAILAAYPHHKMVLLFRSKLQSRQPLKQNEKEELRRFHKLLIK